MVRKNALRDLYPSRSLHITSGRLEEEEWFLWDRVVQLLDMLRVVAADGDNLMLK